MIESSPEQKRLADLEFLDGQERAMEFQQFSGTGKVADYDAGTFQVTFHDPRIHDPVDARCTIYVNKETGNGQFGALESNMGQFFLMNIGTPNEIVDAIIIKMMTD